MVCDHEKLAHRCFSFHTILPPFLSSPAALDAQSGATVRLVDREQRAAQCIPGPSQHCMVMAWWQPDNVTKPVRRSGSRSETDSWYIIIIIIIMNTKST